MCLRRSSTTRSSSKDSSFGSSFENSEVPLVRVLNAVGVKGMGAGPDTEACDELERCRESLRPCTKLPLSPARGVTLSFTNFTTDMNLPRIGAGSSSVARSCEIRECEGCCSKTVLAENFQLGIFTWAYASRSRCILAKVYVRPTGRKSRRRVSPDVGDTGRSAWCLVSRCRRRCDLQGRCELCLDGQAMRAPFLSVLA